MRLMKSLSDPGNELRWIPMLMQTGKHINRITVNHIKKRVRELVEVCTPKVLFYTEIQVGVAGQKLGSSPELLKKSGAHLDVVLLVPVVIPFLNQFDMSLLRLAVL